MRRSWKHWSDSDIEKGVGPPLSKRNGQAFSAIARHLLGIWSDSDIVYIGIPTYGVRELRELRLDGMERYIHDGFDVRQVDC